MSAPLDEQRVRLLVAAFRMPLSQTMTGRKTTITNAFVSALIPRVPPSCEEIDQALRILGMEPGDVRCAYCGDRSTEWDHLRPLVLKQRPTGFISEIANLVPACGKCNQSKGNKPWREWMFSKKNRSPTGRGVPNIAELVARLEAYERALAPTKIDFESIVPVDAWKRYWASREKVDEDLRSCQELADSILRQVLDSLGMQ